MQNISNRPIPIPRSSHNGYEASSSEDNSSFSSEPRIPSSQEEEIHASSTNQCLSGSKRHRPNDGAEPQDSYASVEPDLILSSQTGIPQSAKRIRRSCDVSSATGLPTQQNPTTVPASSPPCEVANMINLSLQSRFPPEQEYAESRTKKQLNKELLLPRSQNLLQHQEDVSAERYAKNVNKMILICFHLRLQDDTLFLSCQILGRVLNSFRVQHARLEVLMLTIVHVAAKYTETYVPKIQDYIDVAAAGARVDKAQILRMEGVVLSALSFELGFPLSLQFALAWLDHLQLVHNANLVQHVKYILELCLVDVSIWAYHPSMVAASAVLLACSALGIQTPSLAWHWNYTYLSLDTCLRSLGLIIQRACGGEAAFHYVNLKYDRVQQQQQQQPIQHITSGRASN
eukprot:c5244_g1_i1.p1 GENE.c5244_g1_i1~~c5244_g1_i1.p1  ORF type:complete len:401 (-),score=82.22 c5244_g1_i1:470-1672(-)